MKFAKFIEIKLLVTLSLILQVIWGTEVNNERSGKMYVKKGLGKNN
jgi:hypothetical protein